MSKKTCALFKKQCSFWKTGKLDVGGLTAGTALGFCQKRCTKRLSEKQSTGRTLSTLDQRLFRIPFRFQQRHSSALCKQAQKLCYTDFVQTLVKANTQNAFSTYSLFFCFDTAPDFCLELKCVLPCRKLPQARRLTFFGK